MWKHNKQSGHVYGSWLNPHHAFGAYEHEPQEGLLLIEA